MTVTSGFLTVAYHACLPPFLITFAIVLVLASFGKSLGVRRLYVRALLSVFEVSRPCPQAFPRSPCLINSPPLSVCPQDNHRASQAPGIQDSA